MTLLQTFFIRQVNSFQFPFVFASSAWQQRDHSTLFTDYVKPLVVFQMTLLYKPTIVQVESVF